MRITQTITDAETGRRGRLIWLSEAESDKTTIMEDLETGQRGMCIWPADEGAEEQPGPAPSARVVQHV